MENPPRYALSSVDNALHLVRQLQAGQVLYVSSVAEDLGIGRSTAHRLLAMLIHHGFATRGPRKEYLRGPALRDPSTYLPGNLTITDLRVRVLPALRILTDSVQETSNVQLLMGDFTRVVASVECGKALRVSNREGQNLPADRSSGGRALLGIDLQQVSRKSLAINDQDIEEGITAIGMAIDSDSLPQRLAVSVAMPSTRFHQHKLRDLATDLSRAASAIKESLAHI